MATRKTDLPALEPDPLEPSPTDVEEFVKALQGLRKTSWSSPSARRGTRSGSPGCGRGRGRTRRSRR